ncbi:MULTISPECIES: hypothetical protein [unclassified Anabaena]|nr:MULTISPECIES: hypothetical protein [unclassified Anabaena]
MLNNDTGKAIVAILTIKIRYYVQLHVQLPNVSLGATNADLAGRF